MKKKVLSFIMTIVLCGVLAGCSESDVGDVIDQVEDIVQEENENVLAVKGGTSSAYPGKTYGEAFESFFGSPAWRYFVGTKEGPDDDGDGVSDYTEDNIDVVEFTGYCTYQDVEVKALIQFTLDKEEGTFEATYLSFNDVPQSYLMLSALIEAVFTNEDIDDTVNSYNGEAAADGSGQTETADKETKSDDSTQTSDDKDYMLQEFIDLICSYSDPPDLEGEELDEYFKEQYGIWLSGEGYYDIVVDESGHLQIDSHSAEYVGE